ncbi:hypothetical protein Tco_0188243, partial [Tanacetum coccineum]
MPHDSPLLGGHTTRSDEGRMQHDDLTDLVTKLINRIEALEKDLQQTKKTYSTAFTKIVLLEDEDVVKDPSKQGRRIAQIDTDPNISLEQDEGTSWFQEHEEVHEKTSVDTEVLLQEESPTKIVEDLGSAKKGEKEISIANVPVSNASPPKVSTTEVSTASVDVSTSAAALVYIRRKASKDKDKGKAIMIEPKPPNKLKKRVQV